MSNSIVSIREMIDTAFGDDDVNLVNFKLIQAILHILARELRVLDRRVEVSSVPGLELPSTSSGLSVLELKLQSITQQQKKVAKKKEYIKHDKRTSSLIKNLSHTLKFTKSDELTFSDKDSKSTSDTSTSEKTLPVSTEKTTSSDHAQKSTSDKTSTSEKSRTTAKYKTSTTARSPSTTDKTTDLSSSKEFSGIKVQSTSKENIRSKAEASKYLAKIEEQRERELRTINQRADSHEEPSEIITPMASISSSEIQQEKILIIERGRSRTSQSMSAGRTEKLSIVTKDQFENLSKVVKDLQKKFEIGTPQFPENAQLMEDLRKGASLTDAMSALQMSARLEAAEKTLQQMLSLITDLAAKIPKEAFQKNDTQIIFSGKASQSSKAKEGEKKGYSNLETKTSAVVGVDASSTKSSVSEHPDSEIGEESADKATTMIQDAKKRPDLITLENLYFAIEEMNNKINQLTTEKVEETSRIANSALSTAKRIDQRMTIALNVGSRLHEVENLVSDYSEQINTLDTALSSAMTNYQEQLTQMQHDLEMGLENMAEALANTSGDPIAIAELNGNFTTFHLDVENLYNKQKDLNEDQKNLHLELENVMQQVELLRHTKSDRDEVQDALRDKAGIDALNGKVSHAQFAAVRGDIEKRIWAAYDKFNNQELVWQKAIDETVRDLSDKADYVQILALRDDVQIHLDILKKRTDELRAIVGEANSSVVTRQIYRDTNCLCCSAPANLKLITGDNLPVLPALQITKPAIDNAEETANPNESGDDGKCYPGYPIPHQIDSRARVCHRYCGGSHTKISEKLPRAPIGISIKAMNQGTQALGTDGKTYYVDEQSSKKPCIPCNIQTSRNSVPNPEHDASAEAKQDIKGDSIDYRGSGVAVFTLTTAAGASYDTNFDSMKPLNEYF